MPNSLSKILAAVIAVILLYIWPISNALNKQDDISEIIVINSVTKFVDSVRDKGYISPSMYNEFVDQILLTGNTFDVEMEHLHKRYDPVYNDDGIFQNDYKVNYEEFYNAQINDTLFPRNSTDSIDDKKRIYKLNVGDFFSVKVKNTNRTTATLIMDVLTGGSNAPDAKIIIPYGGMVLNEDF